MFEERIEKAVDFFKSGYNCSQSVVLAFADMYGFTQEQAARMAASFAAVLLVAGTKGKRMALPHSRVMIHQPLGGAQGQASDIEITAREILKVKKELYTIISTHSGQPYEKVEHDSDRDYWMTAEEALAYGMIDKVLVRNK